MIVLHVEMSGKNVMLIAVPHFIILLHKHACQLSLISTLVMQASALLFYRRVNNARVSGRT